MRSDLEALLVRLTRTARQIHVRLILLLLVAGIHLGLVVVALLGC